MQIKQWCWEGPTNGNVDPHLYSPIIQSKNLTYLSQCFEWLYIEHEDNICIQMQCHSYRRKGYCTGHDFHIATYKIDHYYEAVLQQGQKLSCLTLLSTILQSYRGGKFYWWRKPENPDKTTDLSQVTEKKTLSHHLVSLYNLTRIGVKLTSSVVIDTDCICNWKSNYPTITTTTALLQCSFHFKDKLCI